MRSLIKVILVIIIGLCLGYFLCSDKKIVTDALRPVIEEIEKEDQGYSTQDRDHLDSILKDTLPAPPKNPSE